MDNEPKIDASPSLCLASWNSRGHGLDRVAYIQKLLGQCDILFLPEHWLFNDNISAFGNSIGHDVCIAGISGMNEEQLLTGRPHGGCALLWKRNLNCSFTPINVNSKRIFAGIFDLNSIEVLVCCVYMPCDGVSVGVDGQSYDEVLADISSVIDGCHVNEVIVAGDFNTDLSRAISNHLVSLRAFCASYDLCICTELPQSQVDFTFESTYEHS